MNAPSGRSLKLFGAAKLLLALFLPLTGLPEGLEKTPRFARHVWLEAEGWELVLTLTAHLWPFPILLLQGWLARRRFVTPRVVVALVELWLVLSSAALIHITASFVLEMRWIFPIFARFEAGYYVALAGNGLYLVGWVWEAVGAISRTSFRRPTLMGTPRSTVV
jgi:hypothetical protein